MRHMRLLSVLAAMVLVLAVPGMAWGQLDGAVSDVTDGDDGSGDTDGSSDATETVDQTTKETTKETTDSVDRTTKEATDSTKKTLDPATGGSEPDDDGEPGGDDGQGGNNTDSRSNLGPGGDTSRSQEPAGARLGGSQDARSSDRQPQGEVVAAGRAAEGVAPKDGAGSGPGPGGGMSGTLGIPGLQLALQQLGLQLPMALGDLPVPSVAPPAVSAPPVTATHSIRALPVADSSTSPELPSWLLRLAAGLVAVALVSWKMAWDQRRGWGS